MTGEATMEERALIENAVVRMRARIMALVFAVLVGSGLFVATAWLLVQGGPNVGQHLGLLGNYFPGYTVSPTGAILAFFYGALSGGVAGYGLAWIYNRVVDRRSGG